uniref:Uncharacterized protein n=1 Tax=Aureoumbra lagunensis TaxID=44058 RepID=A0A7S3NGE9_9STRA
MPLYTPSTHSASRPHFAMSLRLNFHLIIPAFFRVVRSCLRIEPKRVFEAPTEDVASNTMIERVVRIEWGGTTNLYRLSRSEFQLMCAQLLERQMPLPLNIDMLSDPRRAIELSFAWPKSTVATVVELILLATKSFGQPATFGCLDAIFAEPQLLRTRLVRNATLALTIEAAARKGGLALALPKIRFKRQLPVVRWFTCYLPSKEKSTLRAGLFEPSLAVALISNAKVLSLFLHHQGLNTAFTEIVSRAKATQIQLLDRLRYDPRSGRLDIALPINGEMGPLFNSTSLSDAFEFFVLLDVLTYTVLFEPLTVTSLYNSFEQ